MAQEIERTYLVRGDGWRRDADDGTDIVQGYLSIDPERIVRIRIADDRATLTIKGSSDGPRRAEYEYPVPLPEARELLELCLEPVIRKRRHRLPGPDGTWEIDVFSGENAGLVVAEIELDEIDRHPERPTWLGEDVTGDPRFANASLVRTPYDQWPEHER